VVNTGVLTKVAKVSHVHMKDVTYSYYTMNLNAVSDTAEVFRLYRTFLLSVMESSKHIIYEKIFGQAEFQDQLVEVRQELFAQSRENLEIPPLSYIDGQPVSGNPISSITVYTITAGEGSSVSYLKDPQRTRNWAAIVEDSFGRQLYGFNLFAMNEGNAAAEMDHVFSQVNQLLAQASFSSDTITRTWIYLDRLLEDYQVLNERRKHFFQQVGVDFSAGSGKLPASTCIEGRSKKNARITIDLYCLEQGTDNEFGISRLYNPLQNEAEGEQYLYKPTFSRGISIQRDNVLEVQISGTASINDKGETVFIDDPYQQIFVTLTNVEALLNQRGLALKDIKQSTCFFKKPEYYQYYLDVLNQMNLDSLSISDTFVIADVCRDNLLFEIDGIAAKECD